MAGSMVRQSIVLSTSLWKPTSLAAAQAELTGDLRILSLVIQHSNTGERVYRLCSGSFFAMSAGTSSQDQQVSLGIAGDYGLTVQVE